MLWFRYGCASFCLLNADLITIFSNIFLLLYDKLQGTHLRLGYSRCSFPTCGSPFQLAGGDAPKPPLPGAMPPGPPLYLSSIPVFNFMYNPCFLNITFKLLYILNLLSLHNSHNTFVHKLPHSFSYYILYITVIPLESWYTIFLVTLSLPFGSQIALTLWTEVARDTAT